MLYDDINALLTNLKCMGVRNFRRDRRRSLTTPAELDLMKAHYLARYTAVGRVPASFAVTFVVAYR